MKTRKQLMAENIELTQRLSASSGQTRKQLNETVSLTRKLNDKLSKELTAEREKSSALELRVKSLEEQINA